MKKELASKACDNMEIGKGCSRLYGSRLYGTRYGVEQHLEARKSW